MASMSEEQHQATIRFFFRRIGRVRTTEEILRALE
jgi:isochorismate hydrolase